MQDQLPLKIFIVYAREDADALKELRVQLIPVARSERLEVWYDGEILPGQHWDKEIKTQLQSADIILLFISKHFFASDYIQTTELKEALERHEEGKSVVVPIIVRHCVWQDDFEVSKFQALPTGAQPIFSSHWRDHDEAMVSVVEGVKKVARNLRAKRTKEEADRKTFSLACTREDFEGYLKKGFTLHLDEAQAKIDDFKKQEQAEAARRALKQREHEKSQKEKENALLTSEWEENEHFDDVRVIKKERRATNLKPLPPRLITGNIVMGLLGLLAIGLMANQLSGTTSINPSDDLFVKAYKVTFFNYDQLEIKLPPSWIRLLVFVFDFTLLPFFMLLLVGLLNEKFNPEFKTASFIFLSIFAIIFIYLFLINYIMSIVIILWN